MNTAPPTSREDIERAVAAFPRWHYQFNLRGVQTPIHDPTWINRHRQRQRYFFDALIESGFLRGKRVLDLGCNAGYWSLLTAEAGCAEVVGIDARKTHVEQAELVFKIKGIAKERYHFIHGNVLTANVEGPFDLVLCLGLLYHTCKPMDLLERISRINSDLLLIDSTVERTREPILRVRREPLDDPRMSADYEIVFLPSPKAITEMTEALGYECAPLQPHIDDWSGCEDFLRGERLAFACSKQTSGQDLFTNIWTDFDVTWPPPLLPGDG